MLGKNTNAERVKTTAGYIFSKYVHCDMRFLVVKKKALACFLNCLGIAAPVFLYNKQQTLLLLE